MQLNNCVESLGGSSLEAVDVVGALLNRVFSLVVLVALLHALEHLASFGVTHVEAFISKVSAEEVGEGGHAVGTVHGAGHLQRVGGREEEGRSNLESSHLGVSEHTSGSDPTTLEGVTSDKSRMRVVADPLECTEPGTGL